MGYQKCITEIQEASGNRLTENDIEAILTEIDQRARRSDARQVSDSERFKLAAAELARDVETANAIQKRNEIIDLEKRVARREFYRAVVEQTGDIYLAFEARLNGVNTPVEGGRRSAEAIGKALQREWLAGVDLDLRRDGVMRAFQSDALEREWTAELAELNKGDKGAPGITGNEAAQKIARTLYKYQRASVDRLNREGAWVRDYFGYVSRTSHDSDKIRAAGKDQWERDVLQWLDVDRTFGGDSREVSRALAELWVDFKDGNHLRFDDGMEGIAFPGMNVAKKASASRVLHWKSSDDWVNNVSKYGAGNARQIMVEGLGRAARTAALMETFGTNPRAAFEADIKWARDAFRGDDDRVRAFDKKVSALTNRFSILDGTANMPANRLLANVTAWTLASQRWSKLGGASLASIADLGTKASELRYQGVDFLDQWQGLFTGYLRGRGQADRKAIADLLGAGIESRIGNMALRFDIGDATPGTIAKIDNVYFKLTGLTQMTENQRSDFEVILSAHLGKQKDKDWATLPRQTQRAFRMAGVRPAQWEMLRSVDWTEAGGRTYLTPDMARRIGDDAVRAHLEKMGKIPAPLADKDYGDAFAQARKVRVAGEGRYANSAAAASEPDAYAAFREVARGLSNRAQRDFEVHGFISNPELGLRQALSGGDTAALAAVKPAPGSAGLTAPYILLSDKGRSLADTGVKHVILNGPAASMRRRLSDLYPEVNFLTPGEARRFMEGGPLPDRLPSAYAPEAIKAKIDAFKDDLATTLVAFYADRGTYAVLETGVREKAILTQGTRPGSPLGIALRLLTQFKAFPTAMIAKVWGREVYGGQGRMGAVSGIVQMLVSSTLLGYVAMTAKDILRGKEPRIPDPSDPVGAAKIIGAAFMQGGGLGLYGDYLFGNYSRHGRPFLEQVAGPSIATGAQIMEVLAAYRNGDDATARAVKLAIDNTPGGNIWWAKTALDHLFMYQLQEMVNPGSIRRMERRIERENGQRFWLAPSESVQ